MSRAKVMTEIAEMVLGHAREALLETYDQHSYEDEKADALGKLAALIERIVEPPSKNVVAPEHARRSDG
jgi:hypothetical protein